jgi:hypothetical protein
MKTLAGSNFKPGDPCYVYVNIPDQGLFGCWEGKVTESGQDNGPKKISAIIIDASLDNDNGEFKKYFNSFLPFPHTILSKNTEIYHLATEAINMAKEMNYYRQKSARQDKRLEDYQTAIIRKRINKLDETRPNRV